MTEYNKPILTIGFLNDAIEHFTGILDHWEDKQSTHYQREYIYCLRALTKELRKQLEGQYCSLKYICEKLDKIATIAGEIATNDIEEEKKNMKHWPVPFGFKYDFKRNVCVPLTEDSTPEEKLHQYMGVWVEEKKEDG